jgi:hypothetical protein
VNVEISNVPEKVKEGSWILIIVLVVMGICFLGCMGIMIYQCCFRKRGDVDAQRIQRKAEALEAQTMA